MPIHDWTKVSSGTFHNFHQHWIIELCDTLNAKGFPKGFFAMAEQYVGRLQADVVAATEEERYAGMATHVAVHDASDHVVSILAIVSPGNKSSRPALHSFAKRIVRLFRHGINLLIVDPFPPGPHDPQGIHPVIWGQISDEAYALPPGKPLTVVSYDCSRKETAAYIDPVAAGDRLPDMPLFLYDVRYVQAPLEAAYQAAWDVMPEPIKRLFGNR